MFVYDKDSLIFLISLLYYLLFRRIHCLTNNYTDVQYPANRSLRILQFRRPILHTTRPHSYLQNII